MVAHTLPSSRCGWRARLETSALLSPTLTLAPRARLWRVGAASVATVAVLGATATATANVFDAIADTSLISPAMVAAASAAIISDAPALFVTMTTRRRPNVASLYVHARGKVVADSSRVCHCVPPPPPPRGAGCGCFRRRPPTSHAGACDPRSFFRRRCVSFLGACESTFCRGGDDDDGRNDDDDDEDQDDDVHHTPVATVVEFSPLSSSSSRKEENEKAGDGGAAAGGGGDVTATDVVCALRGVGFGIVKFAPDAALVAYRNDGDASTENSSFRYVYSKATGMLKLTGVVSPTAAAAAFDGFEAPRWVPIVKGEENVLVANGWSFLDPDESEPISAFDVDAANAEGLYRPKWGLVNKDDDDGGGGGNGDSFLLSSLGFDIAPMSRDEVLADADSYLSPPSMSSQGDAVDSRSVLLHGATDHAHTKLTNDGWDFSGPAGQSDISRGIFVCAVGGLALFATTDLMPTTASSGWLSFSRPVSDDHVCLIDPDDADDARVEVVCARSRCHLGHFFGKGGGGYCINASALNFIPADAECASLDGPSVVGRMRAPASSDIGGGGGSSDSSRSAPLSWRALMRHCETADSPSPQSPSDRALFDALLPRPPRLATAVLGAGCFWRVEDAFRRLPGVVSTAAGYAGGGGYPTATAGTFLTYEQVHSSDGPAAGYAEVVHVDFDLAVLPLSVLMDCFLAMHDPTKVRAHGKHAWGTGQYRSCAFFDRPDLYDEARDALDRCRAQLGKELSTEVRLMPPKQEDKNRWFWTAEDRHQRRYERVKRSGKATEDSASTLSFGEWLREHGRRADSVWGSGETVRVSAGPEPGDDGMAMMMI